MTLKRSTFLAETEMREPGDGGAKYALHASLHAKTA